MKQVKIIHLNWKEYEWDDTIFEKFSTNKDYGIYQVYGDHPVYGQNTLLYIGKVVDETYSDRLKGHPDLVNTHFTFRKLHLSYFLKIDDITNNNWAERISVVEQLLINAHCPAYNAKDIKMLSGVEDNLLVLNWGERGTLLPEVSSLRYSGLYWDTKKYDFEKKILKG
jgi:hypothetical protein